MGRINYRKLFLFFKKVTEKLLNFLICVENYIYSFLIQILTKINVTFTKKILVR